MTGKHPYGIYIHEARDSSPILCKLTGLPKEFDLVAFPLMFCSPYKLLVLHRNISHLIIFLAQENTQVPDAVQILGYIETSKLYITRQVKLTFVGMVFLPDLLTSCSASIIGLGFDFCFLFLEFIASCLAEDLRDNSLSFFAFLSVCSGFLFV